VNGRSFWIRGGWLIAPLAESDQALVVERHPEAFAIRRRTDVAHPRAEQDRTPEQEAEHVQLADADRVQQRGGDAMAGESQGWRSHPPANARRSGRTQDRGSRGSSTTAEIVRFEYGTLHAAAGVAGMSIDQTSRPSSASAYEAQSAMCR
jgi:hypothetical protein